MNKYQVALDYIKHDLEHNDFIRYKNGNHVDKYHREILKELVDRATPMKPIGDLDSIPHYRCPSCFCTVKLFDDSQCDKYCQHCGQAIDWSYEE